MSTRPRTAKPVIGSRSSKSTSRAGLAPSGSRRVLLAFVVLLVCGGAAALLRYGAAGSRQDDRDGAGKPGLLGRLLLGRSSSTGGMAAKAASGRSSSWCYSLSPKQRTVYQASQTSRVSIQPTAADGKAQQAGQMTVLQVAGELHQVVQQHGAEASMLALSLLRPAVSLDNSADGRAAVDLRQLEADLHKPIFARVRPNRRVEQFYYPKGTNPLAANVLKSLFLSSQIVLPGCDDDIDSSEARGTGELTWKVTEDNTTGKYVASYQAHPETGETDVYKQKLRYLQVHALGAAAGTGPRASSAKVLPGSYTLARYDPSEAVLTYVEEVDEVRVDSAGISIDAHVETRLDLVESATDPNVESYANQKTLISKLGLLPSSAVDGQLTPTQKRALWERTVGGKGLDELLREVHDLDGNTSGQASYDTFHKLGAYFNLHPQQLGRLTDAIIGQDPGDPNYAGKLSLLSGTFTSVEHAAAEKSLLRLVDAARHRPQILSQAIGALGDLPLASQDGLNALRQIHQTDQRPANRDQALLALGTMAHRAEEGSPEVQAEATDYLMGRLRSAADPEQRRKVLAALGNAGAATAFDAVLQELGSSSAQRRAAAVYELRRMPGEKVDETLRQFLRSETDSFALNEGLKALRYRPSSENLRAAMELFSKAPSDQTRTAALRATADLGQADRDQTLAFLKGVAGQQQTYSERIRQIALELSTVL